MAYDQNPKFGKDQAFSEAAKRVTDMLWEATKGDLSASPRSYLETLRHEYSEGNVSMLDLIDRVDLGPDATYDDYCEVVDALMSVDPAHWPNPDHVLEVLPGNLPFAFQPDYDFSEFDFVEEEMVAEETITETPGKEVVSEEVVEEQGPDPMSEKVELFLKKVIASVYMDGVTEVTDMEGNPPNEANNYLLSPDGKKFTGIFYDSPPNDKARQYPFTISEGASGNWNIQY